MRTTDPSGGATRRRPLPADARHAIVILPEQRVLHVPDRWKSLDLAEPGRQNTTAVFNKGFYRTAAAGHLFADVPRCGTRVVSSFRRRRPGTPACRVKAEQPREPGLQERAEHGGIRRNAPNVSISETDCLHSSTYGALEVTFPLAVTLPVMMASLPPADPMLNGVKVSSRLTVLLVVV